MLNKISCAGRRRVVAATIPVIHAIKKSEGVKRIARTRTHERVRLRFAPSQALTIKRAPYTCSVGAKTHAAAATALQG